MEAGCCGGYFVAAILYDLTIGRIKVCDRIHEYFCGRVATDIWIDLACLPLCYDSEPKNFGHAYAAHAATPRLTLDSPSA